MKKKIGFAIFLILCGLVLVSCAPKTVPIFGLESGCVQDRVRMPNGRLEYKLKKGCGATELKEDFEARYGGDETYSFTEVNYKVLAVSHTRNNKFDKRISESWIFRIEDGNYLAQNVFSILTNKVMDAEETLAFCPPIKYMEHPEYLYIGADVCRVFVFEGIWYRVRCDFAELKTYYERLGFYRVVEEGENTLLLTLNRQDDDLSNFDDWEFKKSVRLVFEADDPAKNSEFVGWFRAERIALVEA